MGFSEGRSVRCCLADRGSACLKKTGGRNRPPDAHGEVIRRGLPCRDVRDFDLSSRLESTANTAREFALPVAERQGYHEWATALCGSGAGAWWFASLGSLNQNGRDLSNSRLR